MKVTYIELLGKQHPLCFSLAASEKLDEAFGDLDRMQAELFSGNVKRVVKAADTILQVLLNAGRIYMSACGEPLPDPLPCRPADVIDVADQSAINAIWASIRDDSKQEVATETKNAEATQGL